MALDPQSTLDALPALVSTLDASLRYEMLNAQHRAWLGIDPAAAIGRSLWEVVHPGFRAVLEPLAVRSLAGETVDCELEMPRPFRPRWARVTITPEFDASGAVARIHCLILDLGRERALAHRLKRSEAIFNAAFDAAGVGKALVGPDGVTRQVNPTFAEMLGFTPEELADKHFSFFTHPDDIMADSNLFERLKRDEIPSYQLEKRYVGKDGVAVDALLTVSVAQRERGVATFFVAQVVDVRDRKRAEQDVRERNAQLALAMEMIDGGVWHHRFATQDVSLSDKLAARLGLPRGWLSVEALAARIHPEDYARFAGSLPGQLDGVTGAVSRVRDRDDQWRWIRWRRQLVRSDRGQPTGTLGIAFDVTEEQERAEQLTQAAQTDPLTGLFNRRGFDAALEACLHGTRRDGVALLLVDLDRFKAVNDAFGHGLGDRVLHEVGRRLRLAVRMHDVVARLGGDEFAVLLPGNDRASAEGAARRIVAALAEPFEHGDMAVQAGASVGVTLAVDGDDARSIVQRADAALYAVKRAGRGTWRLAA